MKRLFTLVEDQLGFPVFEKIEEAKRELSSKHEGRVRFEYPYINLDELIQKDQFESYIESPIEIILSAFMLLKSTIVVNFLSMYPPPTAV